MHIISQLRIASLELELRKCKLKQTCELPADGLEHQWFSSYLDNRRQFCKVNSVWSDPAEISIGVPQGSCLGPLLFLIYINYLPFALKRAKTTMYADDTAISFSSDNIEEIDAVVNAELACLEKWLQGNKLSLNVVKTQAMIIG